jgi:hypothetical protein
MVCSLVHLIHHDTGEVIYVEVWACWVVLKSYHAWVKDIKDHTVWRAVMIIQSMSKNVHIRTQFVLAWHPDPLQ